MGNNIFDVSELDEWSSEILRVIEKDMPKKIDKFLNEEGKKLRKITLKIAKREVKKRKGNYFKGIKKGRPYTYKGNGGRAIRAYSGKPAYHANLLENGHRLVDKNGNEIGFVQGYHVFEKAAREFTPIFNQDIKNFIDQMTEEL